MALQKNGTDPIGPQCEEKNRLKRWRRGLFRALALLCALLPAPAHAACNTSGTGADRFSPDSTCTRGQIATFLYRGMA